MEIGPTTRNPYLETPDKGVYTNTTATTPMDKEDAAFQNIGKIVWIFQDTMPRGRWPIGRITGDKSTDGDQTRVYTVKTRDKPVLEPAIRLAPVSLDFCNEPANEISR